MPLTPADVHIDAFMDEVERELARLIEENNELRAAAERGGRPAAPVGAGGDPRLAQENAELKAQLDRLNRDKSAAEQAARAMQAEPVISGDGEQQALRVLMMAQRTADDHVADARREADKLLSDARTKAEEVTR